MSDRTTNKISSSVCAVFGMVLFGVAIGLGAAPGRLDPTFSGDGRLTDWPGARFARGVAIQPDGKIVIVGSYRFAPEQRDFRIARYNPDGSPDLSFGGGAGRVTTDFGGNDDSQRVAIQPDGKILVVGVSEENTLTHGSVALARYNQDGSLDTSFGDGSGKVLTLAPCWYAFYGAGSDIALRPDGKIVAALGLGTDENCDTEGLLLRYNSNGILDASFGRGGLVTTRYGLWSVALQPADGKIVTGRFDRIFRFNPNGSRDTTFGSSGMAMLPEGYSSSR